MVTDLLCPEEDTIIEVLSVVIGSSSQCHSGQNEYTTCDTTTVIPQDNIFYQYYVDNCNGEQYCNGLGVVQLSLVCNGMYRYSNYAELNYKCNAGEYNTRQKM